LPGEGKERSSVSIGPRLFRHGNDEVGLDIREISTEPEFQLGHVFSDMEMKIKNQLWAITSNQVSIGPSLFRHGNLAAVGLFRMLATKGFNWATSFQTWKCVWAGGKLPRGTSFQLGHVFSDMEMLSSGPNPGDHPNEFQLGHVFSDMEI